MLISTLMVLIRNTGSTRLPLYQYPPLRLEEMPWPQDLGPWGEIQWHQH